jgi:hypothetical protein
MRAERETMTFDYSVPAQLFMGKRKGGPRQPLRASLSAQANASPLDADAVVQQQQQIQLKDDDGRG